MKVGAPILEQQGGKWVWKNRPDNARKVTFYEEFDGDGIYGDFYTVMKRKQIPALKP